MLARAAEALRPLALDEPRRDEQTRRLTLPVTGGAATLAEALRRLERTGATVLDVGLRRPDLDDVFLTLTGHAAADERPGDPSDVAADRTPAAAGGAVR